MDLIEKAELIDEIAVTVGSYSTTECGDLDTRLAVQKVLVAISGVLHAEADALRARAEREREKA